MNSFLSLFKLQSNNEINNEGNMVFRLNDFEKLKRFIFLGSDNNNLYLKKDILEYDNVLCLENLLDSCRYDDILDVINDYKNKVYKKDYLIYVLARCCAIRLDDDPLYWKKDFKVDCFKLVLEVCTIPTYLFLFVKLYEAINLKLYNTTGWNKGIKEMISNWYQTKSYSELMYYITRYQSGYTWSHKDVLRLGHIKPKDKTYNDIFMYITKGKLNKDNKELEYLHIIEELKYEYNVDKIIEYIEKYNLVIEQVPHYLLNEKKILVSLISSMSIGTLLQNLNKITSLYILDDFLDIVDLICKKVDISDIHPLQVLITLKIYKRGYYMNDDLKWNPNIKIINILETKFYSSFIQFNKINKRILLALDVSGNMLCNNICDIDCLTAKEVSCVMAMILDYTEKDIDIIEFGSEFKRLNISSLQYLEDNLEYIKDIKYESTECELPIKWAYCNNKIYDAIIIFTDNEINCNTTDLYNELKLYRNKIGVNTKLVVVRLTSNKLSIVDPEDSNMIDICGFNVNMYNTIKEFLEM